MDKTMRLMQQKMETLSYGLLRFREGKEHQTVPVNNTIYDGQRLNCVIHEQDAENQLLNRQVVLIQKKGNDYFYINGRIDEEIKMISRIVSLTITKASWFVRKKKGTVVWLQQKCVYESSPEKMQNND